MSSNKVKVIGILGGGQLALMLATAAKKLNYSVIIYSARKDDPAVSVANGHISGRLDDEARLTEFFETVDVVIFENEFINAELIEGISRKTSVGVYPPATSMQTSANKYMQKQILQTLKIPTSRFFNFEKNLDIETWLKKMTQAFAHGFVLKLARGGYDGKGVLRVHSSSGKFDLTSAKEFINDAVTKDLPLYAEELVLFQRELAIVAVATLDKKLQTYQLVNSVQKHGICFEVTGPATEFDVDPAIEATAISYASALAYELKLVGTFAIEMFETKDGRLLVNEFAPRVHNSGHFSLDACAGSQFENHIRAVTGLPLASTLSESLFGMVNILGPEEYSGTIQPPKFSSHLVSTLWYGKQESRPLRKLGHVNVIAENQKQLQSELKQIKLDLADWSRHYQTIGS